MLLYSLVHKSIPVVHGLPFMCCRILGLLVYYESLFYHATAILNSQQEERGFRTIGLLYG